MTVERDPADLPLVAAQSGWVRRLAVELARDAHAGEDIAQDALLAASASPTKPGALRAWLAGAVRNLSRMRRRSEDRRASREQRAARPERVDDPTLALERLELQEALLGAVRGLPEPYRTTVLLRWFEGLEPEEIARRTKTPVRTVHTRVHRALALLREMLDRRSQGDRSRWLAAWLPALSQPSSGWRWVLLMELKTKLALAGLLAALGVSIWIASRRAAALDPSTKAHAVTAQAPLDPAETSHESLIGTDSPTGHRVSELPDPAPGTVAARTIHGRVIDVTGALLPGIPLMSRSEPAARATSDARGYFAIEIAAGDGELDVEAPGWISIYDTRIELPDPVEGYYLVLARPRTIPGFVKDRAGNPIAHANISLGAQSWGLWDFSSGYRDELRRRLGLGLESSSLRLWTTTSETDGSFRLETARIPGQEVRASRQGFQTHGLEPPDDGEPVTLVLDSEVRRLRGGAFDPNGRPVYGASLRLGHSETWSDDHGGFALEFDARTPGAHLIAVHPDWEPVVQPCLSASPTDPGAWPDPLVIRFRQPVAGIRGIVQDIDGKPVRDAEVVALDPPTWDEYLGRIGESTVRDNSSSASVLGCDSVRTGEDGRFHLRGLAQRSYRLFAYSKRTLESVVSEPIPGGTLDAVLVIGKPSERCRFAGSVVDLQGAPIARATISAMRMMPGGRRIDMDQVSTDEQGHFDLPGMSSAIDGFIVWTEVGPAEIVPVDPALPRDAQRLQVGRVARVEVQILTPGLQADTVAFLDASGTALACGTKIGRGGWMGGGDRADLSDGKSGVLIVSERAQTLVLKSQGKEVQRILLHLDPAQVNYVRP